MSVDKDSGQGMSEADHRRARLDTELMVIRRPGMTNAEVAERLSPDLRQMFWRRELNAFFDRELDQ